MKRQQKEAEGEDGAILEYTKAAFNVELPDSKVVIPREKHAPKPKLPTKWEAFRLEKGLPPRKKRSRVIFDPITKDWVPRYGPGSVKKIEEKHNWLMEGKGSGGVDPFTKKR